MPIRLRHSAGPISCTERPCASTATVTGFNNSQKFLTASVAVILVFIIMMISLLVAAFMLSFVVRHGDGG